MSRLIPIELIPNSLWSRGNSVLHLPPQLIASWVMLLSNYHLMEKAMTKSFEGSQGGPTKESTDDHLAWRFTGSCARVMMTMLDPLEELPQITDVFARIFSGNEVFLADLPCGSGAVSMSILSVLCELRKQGRIPRMPLHVVIVGGEISPCAQSYAKEGLNSLIAELEAQAITVEFDVIDWNVCDRFSNTDLIKKLMLRSQNCSAKLLMLANFSGFLQGGNNWKNAQEQFDELFRYSQGDNSVALWIEPEKNDVIKSGGFFPRLLQWLTKKFFESEGEKIKQPIYVCSSINVKHPLRECTFQTKLAVMHFELPPRCAL